MSKKSKFVVPKVKRQIEFDEEDFRTNDGVVNFSESLISKEKWQEFEANALVIADGRNIQQYADEYPIVKYTGEIKSATGFEEERLNGFITSVTVSTVMNGVHFSLKKRKMKHEFTGVETVAYFEDSIGRLTEIPTYDIYRILMKKPNLVVSSDGLLIFFTKEECIATLDCVHYVWVDLTRIRWHCARVKDKEELGRFCGNDDNYYIENITACDGFCKITYAKLVDASYDKEIPENAKVTNEDSSTLKITLDVKITFKLDNLSTGLIDYEASIS